jgi:hypothetical protein
MFRTTGRERPCEEMQREFSIPKPRINLV